MEPSYNFNHPPSVEYYNPIPVAVVYEDNDNYSSKSAISSVSETDSSKEERKGKFVEPRYHFNHPPSAEDYNPIPVSVVYEDNNKYSGKSDITTLTKVEKSDDGIEVSVIGNEDYDDTTTERKQVTSDNPEVSVNNESNVKLAAKPRVLDELQIPVAIVYESDSNIYQNHQKRKTDTNRTSPKPRSSHSLKIDDVNSHIEQTVQISKEETEKVQPRADTRVFKKRTEERDSVVPILDMESYVFSHNGNFHYR